MSLKKFINSYTFFSPSVVILSLSARRQWCSPKWLDVLFSGPGGGKSDYNRVHALKNCSVNNTFVACLFKLRT